MKKKFTVRVCEYVKSIPAGEVCTYGEVAAACKSPRAARAVGSIMAKNFDFYIPCHRVVRSDGLVGDYNRGGVESKTKKLRTENVTVVDNRVILVASS